MGICDLQVVTLWRAPELLPRIMCRHPDVSHFVIGTAFSL